MTLEARASEDRRWYEDHLLHYPLKTHLASSSSSNENDDDSSVAMEIFLRDRMDAVLSNDGDEEGVVSSSSQLNDDENKVVLKPDDRCLALTAPDNQFGSDHGEPRQLIRDQEGLASAQSDGSSASAVSATNSSSSSDVPNSTATAVTVASTPPPAATVAVLTSVVLDPSLPHTPTPTSLSLLVDHSSSPPATIYNPADPANSHSPSRLGQRRELMGYSLVKWKSTPDLMTRRDSSDGLGLTPCPTTDDEDGIDYDDDNSEFALERWSRRIRFELRRAEIAQVAMEAERAAESGLETFTAKLSTYGNEDMLLSPASSATGSLEPCKAPRTRRLHRRKSFSEGTQIRASPSSRSFQYRNQAGAPLGIMNLRDVNEVFPSFSHFHNHLRTHFVRSRVDERSLLFKESNWSDISDGIRHTMLSSDLLFSRQWGSRGKDTRADPSIGIPTSHSRSPSDFFNPSTAIESELSKHKKSPSDFFQSLSFDRWVKPASSSTDPLVQHTGSADVLADHTIVAGQMPRPQHVVVPPGLEMPTLEPSLTAHDARSMSPVSSEAVRSVVKTVRSGLARALFDDDPDSDMDSLHGDSITRVHSADPPLDPQMRSYNPLHRRSKLRRKGHRNQWFESPNLLRDSSQPLPPPLCPPPPPNHSDFMTPARLRVIRSVNVLLSGEILLTPNSMIETIDTSPAQSCERNFSIPKEGSILLPEQLDSGGAEDYGKDKFPYLTEQKRRIPFKPQSPPRVNGDLRNFEEDPPKAALPLPPPLVKSFDEVAAMRSDESDAAAELEAATRSDDNARDDIPETDCYEIGRMLTPDCECDHSRDAKGEEQENADSTVDSEGRSRSVTVRIYGSNCSDREDATSVNTTGILHRSQAIELNELPLVIGTDPHAADCACLALSPVSSRDSACSTPVKDAPDTHSIAKPSLLRRSSSANALSSLEQASQGIRWNPFGGNALASLSESDGVSNPGSKPFHHTALSLFSRISPRRKSLYVPPRENDDFLHNYLYCSKADGVELQAKPKDVGVHGMCANLNLELCFCASLFPDSNLNTFLANRRSAASIPLFSLSGDNNPNGGDQMDAETWFDLNQFEFLDQFSGRGVRQTDTSPWKLSFQAPTLRKGESCRKLRADSVVQDEIESLEGRVRELTVEEFMGFEEKKSDDRSSSRSPKHSRHLSYFPSRQGPQFALSDSQFEMIYGVAPEDLADSLSRDLSVYRSAHLRRDEDPKVNDGRGTGEVGEFEVAAVLANTSKKGGERYTSKSDDAPLIATARSI